MLPALGWLTDYIPAFERAKKQMELWLEILSQLPPEADARRPSRSFCAATL